MAPVIAGLAVGVAFVFIFSVFISHFPVNIQLNEKWNVGDQQRAVDLLLSDQEVRKFVIGRTFEVWAFGMNYPQASLVEGVCEKDECTLIGIRERNADGSVDCALLTYVNIDTGRVDQISGSRPCDEKQRSSLSPMDERALLRERTRIGYEIAENDPRVKRSTEGLIVIQRDFEMFDKRDVVIMTVSKALIINGTWQDGYTLTLADRKLVEVNIVGDSVTLVKSSSLPDDISYWNFTDNQMKMISIAVNYPELKAILNGISDGDDYYVSSIRDEGMGDLGYVVITLSKTHEGFIVTLNQVTGEIIKNHSGKVEKTT